VPLRALGMVSGLHLRIDGIDVPLDDLCAAYESGLPHALEGVTANV
jgi:hypothetical protein